jgi:hypothetical protein
MKDEHFRNLKINGLEIHFAGSVDFDSYDEYLEKVVLTFG